MSNEFYRLTVNGKEREVRVGWREPHVCLA